MESVHDTAALLATMIRAMVTQREHVKVSHTTGSDGSTLFNVVVGPLDRGRVIGKQGRIARSLRILLTAVARENGGVYLLNLDGAQVHAMDDYAGSRTACSRSGTEPVRSPTSSFRQMS